MPMPTHDQVRNIGDVQLKYKFNLIFVKFPAKFDTFPFPDKNELNLRCMSHTVPEKNIENVKIDLHGFSTNQSGRGVYTEEIELVFVETINNVIKKFFHSWREICNKTNTGAGTLKKDSEALIHLEELDTLNNVIWTHKLTGCLYKGGTIGNMDGTTSEAVMPTLRLGYDYFDDIPG